ncbi:hypothetical protein [Holophaga foetida]|uniref:prenylated flavin chaperone LpdD n=1 Tax=Holophaga foetida TaxID=35839 RepID=UPI0002472152|nr:hypothetical protein [Holophaga foetida]
MARQCQEEVERHWVSSSGRLAVELRARQIGKDLLVLITGGEPHIGAVGVGCPLGVRASASVISLPEHRDDRMAHKAAERISSTLNCTCTVVAGVHFDDITPEEIRETMRLFEEVLEAFLKARTMAGESRICAEDPHI